MNDSFHVTGMLGSQMRDIKRLVLKKNVGLTVERKLHYRLNYCFAIRSYGDSFFFPAHRFEKQ